MKTTDQSPSRKLQAAAAFIGGGSAVAVILVNAPREPTVLGDVMKASVFAVPFLIYYVAIRNWVLAGVCGLFLLVVNAGALHSVYTSESSTAAIGMVYLLVWSYCAVLIGGVLQTGLWLFKTTMRVRRELPWNQPVV